MHMSAITVYAASYLSHDEPTGSQNTINFGCDHFDLKSNQVLQEAKVSLPCIPLARLCYYDLNEPTVQFSWGHTKAVKLC